MGEVAGQVKGVERTTDSLSTSVKALLGERAQQQAEAEARRPFEQPGNVDGLIASVRESTATIDCYPSQGSGWAVELTLSGEAPRAGIPDRADHQPARH